jgi:glutathione peroxidase-family protein
MDEYVLCVIGSEFLIKGHWYKLKYPFATQHKIKRYPNEVVLIVNDTDRLWLTNWYDSVNFITKQELRDSNLEIILGE